MRRFASAAVAVLLLHLVVAASVGAAPSQRPARAKSAALAPAKAAAFERFVRASMQLYRTPGLTVGFVRGDQTWVGAYGYADLENRSPAKPESGLSSVRDPRRVRNGGRRS